MACKDHPGYGGVRKPRTDCRGCWEVYNKNQKAKTVIKKDTQVNKGALSQPGVAQPAIEVPVKPEVKLTKEHKAEANKVISELVASLVKEIFDKKLDQLRLEVAAELSIQYEHLSIRDNIWKLDMLPVLEKEGWQWMYNSWPLVEKGLAPGKFEYTVLKRVKRAGNKPVPDFNKASVIKKYKGNTPKSK